MCTYGDRFLKTNIVGLVTTALCAILLCVLVLASGTNLEFDADLPFGAAELLSLANTIANAGAVFGILVALLALIVGLAHTGKPASKP